MEENTRKRKRNASCNTVNPPSSKGEDVEQKEEPQKPPSKRAHVCEVCSVAFLKPAHLQQHLVTHLGQRPFACSHDGCNASFKRQDHLNRHLRAHSQPIFTCPIAGCSVTCTLADNLRAHLKRHQAVRFSCSQAGCSFQTAFKRELWEHTRSSHQARHTCPERQCGKLFKFKSLLASHTACVHGLDAADSACPSLPIPTAEAGPSEHAGFRCINPGCSARFRAKRSLKQHLTVVHLKETRYPCRTSSCPSTFSAEADRDRHAAAKHRAPLAVIAEGRPVHAAKAKASKHKAIISNILDQPTYAEFDS